ncbi:H-type lectin domain-containing protein, partial [Bacillus cereus]
FIQISRGQTLQKQIVWSPAFSKVPFVTVTAANGDIGTGDIVVYLSQVTVTSFTLTVHNKSTTRDISLAFHYIAISMG